MNFKVGDLVNWVSDKSLTAGDIRIKKIFEKTISMPTKILGINKEYAGFLIEDSSGTLFIFDFHLFESAKEQTHESEYRTDLFGFQTNDKNWIPGKWLI